jgi:predicted glycoside hydrolase/deacetylase ChbG (UPF0249 family)
MNARKRLGRLCAAAVAAVLIGVGIIGGLTVATAQTQGSGSIRLLVRGDDMGVAHAANLACVRAYREGIMRSVEIMVPGQWFPEAAQMLRENPGLDVGVHLTLTSEWQNVKWRPLTAGKSIADADGYFYPMTSQRADFPPNTGFLECGWKMDEVERELRAQIELAKKHIPQVSHLSSHMGTPTSTPELKALVAKLAKEYGLAAETERAQWVGGLGADLDYGAREAQMVANLQKLTPGLWIFVEHPGLDVPEMQAMGHKGYEHVARDREGVTRVMSSDRVKQTIQSKGITLISYADLAAK